MARPAVLLAAFIMMLVPVANAADLSDTPSADLAAIPAEQEGPYHGVVTEGMTDAHLYATFGRLCIVPPRYFVTLTHEPTTDVLALQAAGRSAVSTNGRAQVAFDGDCSTQFVISVSGALVETAAAYTVTVTTGRGGYVDS